MSSSSQSSSVEEEKIVSNVKVNQQVNQLETQLSSFRSINGHNINVVRSQDRQLALEQLGYKQELDRICPEHEKKTEQAPADNAMESKTQTE